jgi:hypothetical protein
LLVSYKGFMEHVYNGTFNVALAHQWRRQSETTRTMYRVWVQ